MRALASEPEAVETWMVPQSLCKHFGSLITKRVPPHSRNKTTGNWHFYCSNVHHLLCPKHLENVIKLLLLFEMYYCCCWYHICHSVDDSRYVALTLIEVIDVHVVAMFDKGSVTQALAMPASLSTN